MIASTLRHSMAGVLFSRAGWGLLAAMLSRVSGLVTAILVARTLGKESVGIISLIQTTVVLGGGFVGIGLGMAATRILSEEASPSSPSNRQGGAIQLLSATTLVLLIVAATALTIGSEYIANVMIGSPSVEPYLAIAGLLLVFNGFQQYQIGVLAGLGAFRAAAIANGASTLISLPFLVWAVSLQSLTLIVWSLTLTGFLACAVTNRTIHFHCRARGIHRTWADAWSHRSLLRKYGFLCLLLNLVFPAVDWISFRLLLGHSQGIAELGVYTAANFWCMLVLFIPMNISSAVLSTACSAKNSDDHAERAVLILSFATAGAVSLLACLVLGLLSPWIMLAYGPEFQDRWPVLVLLLAAGVFLSLQVTAERLQIAQDRFWTMFLLKVSVGIGFCVGVAALRGYGADGAAMARLASSFVGAAAFVVLAICASKRSASKISAAMEVPCSDLQVPIVSAAPK